MLFNSLSFLLFFPVTTLGYFVLPRRLRWAWLVVASAVFYMAFVPAYLLILGAVIAIDYVAARLIERATGPRRRALLAISIASNVGLLSVFKYWNFAAENVTALARMFGGEYQAPIFAVLLPIGLSFHTFQSMSYTIEVYRGTVPAERHVGIFALYVLFYPQLVAGPIERPQNLLPQFHDPPSFSAKNAVEGLRSMLWGMIKKVVIADQAAEVTSQVFGAPGRFSGPTLLFAAYLFSIQIYCDFSGYSDIARGAARVMGFDLMRNFRQPYFAASMGEFWRRWHISLSTWFKDYVYVPLGGGRVRSWRRIVNVMVVFLLSGLWHGAAWHYVVWGAINGVLVALEGHAPDARGRARLVRAFVVFQISTLAWIFFRANSIGDAWSVFAGLRAGWTHPHLELAMTKTRAVVLVTLVLGLFAVDAGIESGKLRSWFSARPRWLRWSLYYAAIAGCVFFGSSEKVRFIYFQF